MTAGQAAPAVELVPDESLDESVARTVEALTATAPADLAAVHLARLLARQIDQAAAVERAAAAVLRRAEAESDDDLLVEQVRALRAKLGEREALDRLGGALRALLVELGATPKSRGRTTAAPAAAGPGKLTGFRGGLAGTAGAG